MQCRHRRNCDDEFDAADFSRQSAKVVYDQPVPQRVNTYGVTARGPRSPTMTECDYADLTTAPGLSFGASGTNDKYNINPGQSMPAATDTHYANANASYNTFQVLQRLLILSALHMMIRDTFSFRHWMRLV